MTVQELIQAFKLLADSDKNYFLQNVSSDTVFTTHEAGIRQQEKTKLYESIEKYKNDYNAAQQTIAELNSRIEEVQDMPQDANTTELIKALTEQVQSLQSSLKKDRLTSLKQQVVKELSVPENLSPYLQGETLEDLRASAQGLMAHAEATRKAAEAEIFQKYGIQPQQQAPAAQAPVDPMMAQLLQLLGVNPQTAAAVAQQPQVAAQQQNLTPEQMMAAQVAQQQAAAYQQQAGIQQPAPQQMFGQQQQPAQQAQAPAAVQSNANPILAALMAAVQGQQFQGQQQQAPAAPQAPQSQQQVNYGIPQVPNSANTVVQQVYGQQQTAPQAPVQQQQQQQFVNPFMPRPMDGVLVPNPSVQQNFTAQTPDASQLSKMSVTEYAQHRDKLLAETKNRVNANSQGFNN